MSHRSLSTIALAVVLLVATGSPSVAGRLADLPWDEQVPQDVRGAVRRALTEEARELKKEENDARKKFVHVRTNKHVELTPDGKAMSNVTIQRCLEDKMVTEQWRYTLEPKGSGPDYKIVDRKKMFEFDDAEPNLILKPDAAQTSKAFTFEHDKLKLTMNPGAYIVSSRGTHPNTIHLAATGRMTLEPVNDYEKMFFERRLKTGRVDTEITAAEIEFHEADSTFVDLIGFTTGTGTAGDGGAGVSSILEEMYDRETDGDDERKYSPGEYGRAPLDELKGSFSLRVKTKDFGWMGYLFNPTGSPPTGLRQILVFREKKGFSFQEGADSYDLVSHYDGAETRKLPLRDQENRLPFVFVSPYRFEGIVHVDEDGFLGTVDIDMQVLRDTKRLSVNMIGDTEYRFIKEDLIRDLPYVPQGDSGVEILFPEERKAGSTIRLRIGYETKWAQFGNQRMGKISESTWLFPRGLPFMPFQSILSGPSYMHLVVRTKEDLQHVTVGAKLSEEVSGGYRYTEWGTESTVNFPNLIIGKYHDPVVDEVEGIKVTGYMTKNLFGQNISPKRNDMIRQVDLAKNSLELFGKWFGAPYQFRELKLVSAPLEGLGAQSPSSTVYVGEPAFYPPAILAEIGMPPYFVKKLTPHEVAHQWWGGHVANRNGGHYWFVETLADLSAAFFEAATRGDNEYPEHIAHWRKNTLASDWSCSVIDDVFRMEVLPVQPLRYTKGPYVMHMLGEYFGQKKLVEYMKNVMQKHSGDYITTWDLQAVASETFGGDMQWFFDQWIRGVGIPRVTYDYSTRQAEDGKNWLIEGNMSQVITLKGEEQSGKFFENLLVPVTIELGNGETVKKKVVMGGPEQGFTLSVPGRPRSVKVNDGDKMLIEVRKAG